MKAWLVAFCVHFAALTAVGVAVATPFVLAEVLPATNLPTWACWLVGGVATIGVVSALLATGYVFFRREVQ